MNVSTIAMPAELAQEKVNRYKKALEGREPTPEDTATILGYKTLAAGKQLLDLFQVFRACPLDQKQRPRFAIARASWPWCHYRTDRDWAVFASDQNFLYVDSWRPKKPRGHVRIPARTMPTGVKLDERLRAVVPTIPLPIRPRGDLSRYHILWEVEWQPIPPKDPLLLKRLTGSLYVILAAWDLTELEQAVLAGRFEETQ